MLMGIGGIILAAAAGIGSIVVAALHPNPQNQALALLVCGTLLAITLGHWFGPRRPGRRLGAHARA